MKKAYIVYLDDGRDCYKLNIPAESKTKAIEYVKGNGEVIKCVPGERNAQTPISLEMIAEALIHNGFGREETDLITRALSDCEFIA